MNKRTYVKRKSYVKKQMSERDKRHFTVSPSGVLRIIGKVILVLVLSLVVFFASAMLLPLDPGPKARSLATEDFGLGFKAGDEWIPETFEAAMKANAVPAVRQHIVEDVGVAWGEWVDNKGSLYISTSTDYMQDWTYISDIKITSYLTTAEGAPKPSPDIYAVVGLEAKLLYPQVVSKQGIGFGADEKEVVSTYGKPMFMLEYSDPYHRPILVYATDKQLVCFGFTKGVLTHMDTITFYRSKYMNRFIAWAGYFLHPLVEHIMDSLEMA